MQTRQQILSRIETFRTRHGFGRVRFGVEATGNREFVRELERGDSITLARIEKAEAFMSAYEAAPGDQPSEVRAAEVDQEQAEVGDRVEHARAVAAGGRRRQRGDHP
jgi:hypothetical protein